MVALICLLVFVLTGQAGVQGYVWCLGEDGHAVLEYASGKGCGPDWAPQGGPDGHRQAFAHLESGDHCGPCLDIPTTFEATARRSPSAKFSAAPAAAAPAFSPPLPAFARAETVSLSPQPPPRPRQSLLFQRTVVLLN